MTNEKCPSRFSLEKFFLENPENLQFKEHLLVCTSCSELVQEMQSERTAFLFQKPFVPFYNRLEEKIKRRDWMGGLSKWFSWQGLLPLGSIALLLLVFRLGVFSPNEIRFKGSSEIGFYILDRGESVKGKRVQTVHAGDQIRLTSNSSQYPYVIIYGVEEDGTLNRYYPDRGDMSFPVPVGEPTLFPDSIILDTSPHNELFVGVFSHQPLSVASVEEKLLQHFLQLRQEGKSIKDWESAQFDYPQSVFLLEKK